MIARWMWYTFALVALFLVLSRYEAANALLKSGAQGYISAVGALQGRTTTPAGGVTGIAR